MVVPAALGQLPQVRVWHFEVPATLSLSDGPGVDPHELDHKTWGLLPAPLDTTSLAIQEELGGRREAFCKVRQGKNLDGPFKAESADHLTDSDHR